MSGVFNKKIFKNREFEKICRMSQKTLKSYVAKKLGDTAEVGDGYVFYKGTFPVLLTAHMDTVHKHLPGKIEYKLNKFNKTIISSPNGIGGDDRCGIYMIFQILKEIDCSVIFCEDEEIGSVGAEKFTKTDLCKRLKEENGFKYIIELDRMNNNDAVFYHDGNEEFHKFVTDKFWEKSWGTWSDICTLSPALGISSVNLSCGYYKQHTTAEYVVLDEMETAIKEVIELLKRTDLEKEPYKFVRAYTNYYGTTNYRSLYDYDYYDDDDDWLTSYYRRKYESELKEDKDKIEEEPKKLTTSFGDKIYLEVWVADPDVFGTSYLMSAGETVDEAWKNMFFENGVLCYADIIDYQVYAN